MPLADLIVGTWVLVSSHDIEADGTRTDTWGANPLGTYMFDANGRFAQIVMRSDLPRVMRREDTSDAQAKAVVMGSLAMFGTYTVDEAARVVAVRFEACTFASFTGTEGSRVVERISADELVFSNAGRAGGRRGESVWRRAGSTAMH
jgi:hypothetical protein